MRKLPGVEVSTGSLGQGLSLANGMALALRLDGNETSTVFCLLGDGELQEGSVWEAAMAAAHYNLSNVVAVVDLNGLQIDGATCEVMDLGNVPEKFASFGWTVMTCNGHSVEELHDTLTRAKADTSGPVVIVARTMKGRGVSFMENLCDWHGKAPNAEECALALTELAEGSDR
jgi:transketolase